MLETMVIIAVGVSVLVLMTGTIAACGFSLSSPVKNADKVDKEQLRKRLRQDCDSVYDFSEFDIHSPYVI